MVSIPEADILIIGGGGAGLRAAIEAAQQGSSVAILDKGPVGRSGTTPMAMEAFQAVCHPEDSAEQHFQDTVSGGLYLGDENLIWVLVTEAKKRVADLENYGVHFKKKENGRFDPMQHPGQTFPRTLFIQGGGYGLLQALLKEAHKYHRIRIMSDVLVTNIIMDREGVPGGVIFLDLHDGKFKVLKSRAAILATGGYEELWAFNDASVTACGDGLFLAYELGAKLVDLEMLQFYPTIVIYPPEVRGTLFQYELVINPELLGGRILNGLGETFFSGMPLRDVLLRAIWQEIQQGRGTEHGGVYIDLTASSLSREALTAALNKWQPNQFHYLKDMGIDLRDTRVEVAPHAHYTMGGVAIDENASTSIPGLFAAGEVAGNLHGANRVSGNALTETQVFGAIAGAAAAQFARQRKMVELDENLLTHMQEEKANFIISFLSNKKFKPRQMRRQLKEIMWKYCGIERDEIGLKRGLNEIKEMEKEIFGGQSFINKLGTCSFGAYPLRVREALELKMMITLSQLILISALFRKETRGHHIRTDFLSAQERGKHTLVIKGKEPWAEEVRRKG
ncbi:MAG: FAD-dependent oxidoreductase [Thermodesulfobacteriota bacterium]